MSENITNLTVYCQQLYRRAQLGSELQRDEIVYCWPNPYGPIETWVIQILLSLLTILTAGGNVLIGVAILLVRRLRSPANLLLLNLALSDFLISILVLPFAIVYQVRGYWPFSMPVCNLYIVSDVLLCTASILSLCAISIDRYLAITRPLTYAVNRTTSRMLCMIAVCWSMAALISIPPVFGWEKPVVPLSCGYSEDLTYQIYATFSAFYIPLTVMLVLYGRIYLIVRKLSMQDSQALTQLTYVNVPQNGRRSCSHGETVFSMPGDDYPADYHTLEINPPLRRLTRRSSDLAIRTSVFPDSSRSQSFARTNSSGETGLPDHTFGCVDDLAVSNGCGRMRDEDFLRVDSTQISMFKLRWFDTFRSTSSKPDVNSRPRQHAPNAENMKAVITLGVIMGTFTLCWLPFFICQLMNPILKVFHLSLMDIIPIRLFQFFLWLGYMNSLFNPIIYAKFNQDFRMPFYYILKCQCRGINRRVRRMSFTTQYNANAFDHSPMSMVGTTRPSTQRRRPTCRRDTLLLRNVRQSTGQAV